jgi:flagellar biosynthesis/type III secretory pathway ATPase
MDEVNKLVNKGGYKKGAIKEFVDAAIREKLIKEVLLQRLDEDP